MADDELNIPTHRYYQQRFNVQLANEDISREYIYASGIRKIEARIGEVVIREPLFLNNEPGIWLDPSDVADLDWRRNLLTYTEDFSNAYWTAGAVNLTSLAAGRITPNTTSGQHRYDRTTTIAAAAHTFSMEVKADGYNFIWIRLGAISAVFNTTTGDAAGVTSGATASFTNANDGYIRITLSGTAAGNDTLRINVLPSTSTADFAGDGTSGILIRKAQLELGSVATDYQRISNVNTEVLERFPKTTMFQDRAGTTAVTTPGQPVGLMLDKSQGLVLGSELVTNGTFDSDVSGWQDTNVTSSGGTVVATSGEAVITRGTARAEFFQTVTTVVGRTYTFVGFVTSKTGSASWWIGTTRNNASNLNLSSVSVGQQSGVFTATATTTYITMAVDGAEGQTATIDNVSVKELPGNHVAQPTAAARPRYIVDADGTFIQHDLVDDALTVTLPDMGTEATVAYVTRSEVRLLEDQTISGSYTLPKQEIAGFIAIDRALTQAEKINVIRYLASKVEGVNYGAEIDRLTLIAINAVDVFVYDTSKDSDGGAWRAGALAQASSWYNETLNTATRGARREFPAVAVIVAETNKVTIYDGDDPALPMWMVFNGSPNKIPYIGVSANISSIDARQGVVSVGVSGTFGAFNKIDFNKDFAESITNTDTVNGRTIANRDVNVQTIGTADFYIVNRTVNDVAMTVLPDAPIDPATGLPVPTIAVATAGGVSVIKDDGTVQNLTGGAVRAIAINDNEEFIINFTGTDTTVIEPLSTTDTTIAFNTGLRAYSYNPATGLSPFIAFRQDKVVSEPNGLAFSGIGGTGKLQRISEDFSNARRSLLCDTTSKYNTGWMNGNIKGAFLSDTDDTDLVGSGELVTNGDFATGDLTGFTDESNGTGTVDASSGAAVITSTDSSNRGKFRYTGSGFLVGSRYRISFGLSASTYVTATGVSVFPNTNYNSNTEVYVTANSTTVSISFERAGNSGTTTVDNISVKLADADRSVNNKGLIINGTVTRSPVATGADLVAYSGFSASNYLEQPYNSALDFGTGDFCVMGWFKTSSVVSPQSLAARYAPDDASPDWRFNINSSTGYLSFRVDGTDVVSGATNLSTNIWTFAACARVSGIMHLYVNGNRVTSASNATSLTNAAARFSVGTTPVAIPGAPFLGSLALWRISATAPSAEQIAKIYNDEKVLFQDKAQATLYGASDAVTALAHDPDTDLLHVGTSAGRSVFEGLRRVGNTTTSVSTSISASGGLIVEK